jgi:hypothetical protein
MSSEKAIIEKINAIHQEDTEQFISYFWMEKL